MSIELAEEAQWDEGMRWLLRAGWRRSTTQWQEVRGG
jgi:hypothetical protein